MESLKEKFGRLYRELWFPVRSFLMKSSPRWFIFLVDLAVVNASFLLAYLVRFNFAFHFESAAFFKQLLILNLFSALFYFIFKPYKGVVRHTGFKDIQTIGQTQIFILAALLTLTFLSRNKYIHHSLNYPLSVSFLTVFFAILFMIGLRLMYKTFFYRISREQKKIFQVLIYGTDQNAVSTAKMLSGQNKYRFYIKGFISDDPKNAGKKISGYPVFYLNNLDDQWINRNIIDQIIISQPVINPLPLLKKLGNFTQRNIPIKIIPPADTWIDRILSEEDIRNFDLEMLLERIPIQMEKDEVITLISNKVVMVTGAAGSIGSELVRQIIRLQPRKLILLDQAETPLYELELMLKRENIQSLPEIVLLDIEDFDLLRETFEKYRPQIVFHAAAYKHVPMIEKFPHYGISVNIFATLELMKLSTEFQVERFIQISTDKAVNPTNVMGATKRVAELIARCLQENQNKTKFIITRFGNVLGSNGSVIHLFKKQIKSGGPLTVTHKEITRYFMTVPEAVNLVLKAANQGKGGEIFVFDMGEPIRIFDLAVKMIQLSGKRYPEDIDIIITGLRPGEKLKEELLTSEELVEKTNDEKLYISKLSPLNCELLQHQLNQLRKALKKDTKLAVEILKEIIPEYKPQHSPFS